MCKNPRFFSVVKGCNKGCYLHPERRSYTPIKPYARIRVLCVLIVIAGFLFGCDGRADTAKKTVRVNAAASIAYVIEGLAETIERDLDISIEVNAGASGTLAQQIEQGDRADLFISADPLWIDRLEQQGLTDPTTRTQLVENRLVVVGLPNTVKQPRTLAELSAKEYQPLAIGDPAYVPAGRYALQALKSHGLERGPGIEFAEAPNVRAALAFVRSGQCPAGLVYASDALGEAGVEVLLTIDPADHDPIRYPVVLLKDAPHREQAMRLLDWFSGDAARSAFRDAGFAVPASNN